MATTISLDKLVESGAHFGHQSRRWNPKMEEYLYGVQDGVHLFDLTITKSKLEEALKFLKTAKKEGKIILLLGTKKQVKEKIIEVGAETNVAYVSERWLGGTLTNFVQIKRSIDKLADMKIKREAGEYSRFTKKERLLIDREIERLTRFYGGVSALTREPDILFIIDVKREASAVREASRRGLTTVAIVDSNADPIGIDYVIPMNDDSTKALAYVLDLVKATLKGSPLKAKRKTS